MWLNQPKTTFGGRTPFVLAHTEAGYDRVKAELEKVSHGYACSYEPVLQILGSPSERGCMHVSMYLGQIKARTSMP
ncbi:MULTISPECIES: MbcA/ParS/Xre antitoxin family protein [Pseudomonas]|uniref:MbcA/ParS/Xre antitoxin family protein n=1 Tax=Pseudomonas TaxID=286 RepID=UPI001CC269C2|nr:MULTISPECIES: MbcA/ParS/Xre antitoxin family protein [Pseudomonas]